MRSLIAAIIIGTTLAATMATASAAKPFRDVAQVTFDEIDELASAQCGAQIHVTGDGTFSTMFRQTNDGELLVTARSNFHQVFTNLDTGKSTNVNGANTAHVAVGVGTEGRDVVRITGLQGHIVTPGSGSAAQDSGQLVLEAFGPEDMDPIVVSVHGLFEGMGGPFPALCEILS